MTDAASSPVPAPETPASLAPGDELICHVDSLALGGRGVARPAEGGPVLFLEGAVPGALVRARITARRKRLLEGRVIEVLEPSPDQVEPPCPHFADCGGCAHQDMAYPAQVAAKSELVVQTLARIGRVTPERVLEPIPSPRQLGYRNSMAFAFQGAGQGLRLGLRRRGAAEVLDLSTCLLQSPERTAIMLATREFCREQGLAAFDARSGKGFLRRLVLRQSETDGEMLVRLITTPGPAKQRARLYGRVAELGEALREQFPQVVGFVHETRRDAADLAFGERRVLTLGRDWLHEKLAGCDYRIPGEAFFQTNTAAAEELVRAALELAEVRPGQRIWDLYCGVGTFSLPLARLAGSEGEVLGVELSRAAIQGAEFNARAAGLGNLRFLAEPVESLLQELAELAERARPDLVVCDPPREGLATELTELLAERGPERLVYVSCDPATLARDAGRLSRAYRAEAVRAVDMFPQTPHIEAILVMQRT